MQDNAVALKGIDAPVEPIRESVMALSIRLFLLLFVSESLFALLLFFFSAYGLWEHVYILTIFHVLKMGLQIFLVIAMVIEWINDVAYVVDTYLIHHHGILNVKEKMYDLKIVRSVTVEQGLLGKIFNYGDIDISTSASGGYHDEVYLPRIPNPNKYKEIFERFFRIKSSW